MSLPPALAETYARVLGVLRAGDSLKDDTYLAHLLDCTVAVVTGTPELEQLQLLPLLQEVLGRKESSPSLRPFLLRLSSLLLPALPHLGVCLVDIVTVPDWRMWPWEDTDLQEELCSTLQFFTSIFGLTADLLDLAHRLSDAWSQFLLPVIQHSHTCDLYIRRASNGCFAAYIRFLLRVSNVNMKPKGCEIRSSLESRLRDVLLIWGQQGESADDLFTQQLCSVASNLNDNDLATFFGPIVIEHANFASRLDPGRWKSVPSSSIVKLFVMTHKEEPLQVQSVLLRLFHSPSSPPHLLKLCVRLAAERPSLPVLPSLLPSILKEKHNSFLLSYLLSLHAVPAVLQHCAILPSFLDHLLNSFVAFSDDPSEGDKHLKCISIFLSKLVSAKLLDSGRVSPLLQPLLEISSLHLSVCADLRSSLLGLLSVLLTFLPSLHLMEPTEVVRTLCSLSLESSAWPVQDSALTCLSSLLTSSSLSTLLHSSLPLLLTTLHLCLRPSPKMTSYVRCAAIRTQTALLSASCCHLTPRELVSLFPFAATDGSIQFDLNVEVFLEQFDESERRELVRMSTEMYRKLLGCKTDGEVEDLKRILEKFVIMILAKDQDWESKQLTVHFWRLCHTCSGDSGGWMTGLALGCEDYEVSVRTVFRQLVMELGMGRSSSLKTGAKRRIKDRNGVEVSSKLGRRVVCENDTSEEMEREEHIDKLLDEPYQAQLEEVLKGKPGRAAETELATKSWYHPHSLTKEEFSQWLQGLPDSTDDAESAESRLQAVLEDILHSTSDSNLIDMVDCY